MQNDVYRSGFLEQAKQQLGGLGISPEHIEEYFQSGRDPGLFFTLKYQNQYEIGTIGVPFYERADQFALDKIREWLGFE
ncbi:MAG: hypothetical protein HY832_03570 [Candidatus Aenigmarchaeota archaeon]|nr:hypothetical protein [Candidatus Aenigmarchaeota archaeon]